MKQFVIVGLGNPGPRYEYTRHNMGFLVVKAFAKSLGAVFKSDSHFNALIAKIKIVEKKRGKNSDEENNEMVIHLILPMTYMNLSGIAVKNYINFHKLRPSQLIVVVDDIALPFGQFRLRMTGSSGGHNGLKSIEDQLQTREYIRLRIGIDQLPLEKGAEIALEGVEKRRYDLADYVLGSFSLEELNHLPSILEAGCQALQSLCHEPIVKVMSRVNTNNPTPKKNM